MPYETFGCGVCGRQAPVKLRKHGTFSERMSWVREHRKKYHPKLFKQSVRKGVETRRRNRA